MPEIIIHEKVAYDIANKYDLKTRDFFLGALMPDTPNLEGMAPKEERWTSHIRRKDLNEWREALKDFYDKEKDNYSRDFILGYVTHILTDINHDDYLYLKQRKRIKHENNCDNDKAHEILRLDMKNYRFKEWNEIINILKSDNKFYKILNNTCKKEKLWTERMLNEYLEETSSKYQTKEDIEVLTLLVEKDLKYYL